MRPARGAWWWLYRHVPGFAPLSEGPTAFLSRRRGLLAGARTLLWGRTLEPERYDLVVLAVPARARRSSMSPRSSRWRCRSAASSAHDGILPLGEYLAAARDGWGTAAYWRLPTLFWLNASDAALIAGAIAGIALGLLVTSASRSAWRSSPCSSSTCRSSTPGSCS